MRQIIRLGVQRSPAGLGLMVIMALGVLIAATLLASAPIYARSMSDLGLTYAVRHQVVGKPSTQAIFFDMPLKTSEGAAIQQAASARLQQRLGWFEEGQEQALQLGRFTISEPGVAPQPGDAIAQPVGITGYATHVRLLEGHLPRATPPGAPIQVTVSQQGAVQSGLKPGDRVQLNEEFDNCERELQSNPAAPPPPPCNPSVTLAFSFPAEVVGIVEPDSANDPFWSIPGLTFFAPYRIAVVGTGPVIPMLADEPTLLNSFGKLYPGYTGTMAWSVLANPADLTRTNYQRAIADINGLSSEFATMGGIAYSPLRDALLGFGRSASYQQTPLLILLLELTGIAVFYVVLVSALVVERQASEIALFRSRGATVAQIALLYLVEALVIGIPMFLAAPFLSAGAIALLGLTPPFHAVTGGATLPVTIVPLSLPLAAVGIVLSIVAFVVPAAFAARNNAVTSRRSDARPRKPFIQRYYIDVGLVAVAVLLLYELHQRGSVFQPSTSGSFSSDPLLLASPAVAIVAAAAIILRVYPVVLWVISKATRTVAGASLTLGLWESIRNPSQYTRLALLLMMAVAVGVFAASYTATADRSYADQANFNAGADVRAHTLSSSPDPGQVDGLARQAAKLPGVERATPVIRTTGAVAGAGTRIDSFQVLGVDPAAAGAMLWTRSDLAPAPLSELLAGVAGPPEHIGTPLPDHPGTLSLEVTSAHDLPGLNVWAGVFDAAGKFTLVPLGDLSTVAGGWHTLSVNLVDPNLGLTAPLWLETIAFSGRSGPAAAPLYIANLTVTDQAGHATALSSLTDGTQWAAMPSTAPNPDTVAFVAGKGPGGSAAAEYHFNDNGLSSGMRGMYFNNALTPIPAIVSNSFVTGTGVREGATVLLNIQQSLVPIVVTGTFSQFPTTSYENGPVVVVDLNWLEEWSEAMSSATVGAIPASEVWLQLKPGANSAAIAKALQQPPYGFQDVVTRASALQDARSNPLIAASGTGILLAAFIGILVLVAVAILASLVAALSRRQIEFAVVRALGLSRRQFFRMLLLEYSVVFVIGVGAGIPLGLFISSRMLGFLNVTESGLKAEPPFILVTQWGIVGVGVAIVVAVFGSALAVAGLSAIRTADGRALRGE